MKHKYLIPVLVLGIFLVAPFTSFAATTSNSSHEAVPNVGTIPCSNSEYLKIWYNEGHSLECFSGNGYTGPGLSGVTEVDPGNNCGWIVGYINGSSYKYILTSYSTYDSYDQVLLYGSPLFNTLTQLDIQGQGCSGHPSSTTSPLSSSYQKTTKQASTPQIKELPAVTSAPCTTSDYMKIWFNNGQTVECFTGDGYTGVSLSGVTEVDPGNNCGWYVAYRNGTSYKVQINSFFAQYQTFNTQTQLEIQGQNCNGSV